MITTYKIKLEKYVGWKLTDCQGFTLIVSKPYEYQKPHGLKDKLKSITKWIVDAVLSDVGGDLRDRSFITRELDDRYEVENQHES